MKTIQIGNVPADVHRVVRMRATAAGMSLSDYALEELERVARHPPVGDLLARARAASAEAIVSALRSGRDRLTCSSSTRATLSRADSEAELSLR